MLQELLDTIWYISRGLASAWTRGGPVERMAVFLCHIHSAYSKTTPHVCLHFLSIVMLCLNHTTAVIGFVLNTIHPFISVTKVSSHSRHIYIYLIIGKKNGLSFICPQAQTFVVFRLFSDLAVNPPPVYTNTRSCYSTDGTYLSVLTTNYFVFATLINSAGFSNNNVDRGRV